MAERRVLPTNCQSPAHSPDEAQLNRDGRVAASFECDSRRLGMTWAWNEALELPGEAVWVGDLNDRGDIVGLVLIGETRAPALWQGGELAVIPLPQGVEGGHIEKINEQARFIGTFNIDDIPYFFVGDDWGDWVVQSICPRQDEVLYAVALHVEPVLLPVTVRLPSPG